MAELKRFWMVIGLGQGQPTAKQNTREKAHAEAVRLAGKHPGVEFYVLETVARAISTTVQFDIIYVPPSNLESSILETSF